MNMALRRLRRFYRRAARRARRSRVVFGLFVLVCPAVLIVSLPVTLPLAVLLHAPDLRRLRAVADRFACLQCGEVLGRAALERADTIWVAHVEQLHREHPGYRFRLVRNVHAVCTHCGKRYRFDDKLLTLQALDA